MTTTPDCKAAALFLTQWKPEGPWPLCAFHEQRGNQAFATFGPDTAAEMQAWIDDQAKAQRNVYFHVNTVTQPENGKANKGNVRSVDWLHVDIDPRKDKPLREEQKRILAKLQEDSGDLPKPTVIIFSGGGYQAFWKLQQPIVVNGDIAKIEDAERYTTQIARLFVGADNCHNMDRVMRLPGTINWPNEKKRLRGQEPVMAAVLPGEDWDRVYPIDEFEQAQVAKGATLTGSRNQVQVEISGNLPRISVTDLDEHPTLSKINSRAKVAIVMGHDPDQPLTGDNSRSEWCWYVVCEMTRNGVDDDTMAAVLLDKDLAISEHVYAQGNAAMVDRYVRRQIQRAKERAINPMLEEMNRQYAVVESVGGKFRIARELLDPAKERFEVEFHQKDGFLSMWSNKFVEIIGPPKPPSIEPTITLQPVGTWWMKHPNRREYRNVVFYPNREFPDSMNLWRGFSVEAKAGDCGLFLDHLLHVLCKGNRTYYDYLIRWMANAIQNPHLPGQVAVVLRGGQGTGKGTFGNAFGKLFGTHYKYVSNPKHVTGQFNAVLTDCVFLFADECFAANDKVAESALKALITEPFIRTEQKGVDNMEGRNCTHLCMATNSNWAISADLDDRRFFVLEVDDAQQTNAKYFGALNEQLENGGYEALMHHLLHLNLEGFNVRNCPKTAELRRQQEQSMSPTQAFILNILEDGRLLPEHAGWRDYGLKEALVERFRSQFPRLDKDPARTLGIALSKLGAVATELGRPESWVDSRGQSHTSGERPKIWRFLPLDKMRKLWGDVTKVGEREWAPAITDDNQAPTDDGGQAF